ncbi:hypothetical protein Pelo_694 [Pelomyxa schiedti]|nr:hypothetical protein Pelo_694 [Pelomyxa schiedti]
MEEANRSLQGTTHATSHPDHRARGREGRSAAADAADVGGRRVHGLHRELLQLQRHPSPPVHERGPDPRVPGPSHRRGAPANRLRAVEGVDGGARRVPPQQDRPRKHHGEGDLPRRRRGGGRRRPPGARGRAAAGDGEGRGGLAEAAARVSVRAQGDGGLAGRRQRGGDGKLVAVCGFMGTTAVTVYSFPAMLPLFTLDSAEFKRFGCSNVAWLGPNAFVGVRTGDLLLCTIPATPNTHNSPCPIQTEEGTAILLSRKFDGVVNGTATISPVHHQAVHQAHADAIAVLLSHNSPTEIRPGELHLFTGLFDEEHCSHRILSRHASSVASSIGRIFAQIIQPDSVPQIVIFHSETGDPLSSLACPFSPPLEVLTVYSGTVLTGIQDGSKLVTWDLRTVRFANYNKEYHKDYIQHPAELTMNNTGNGDDDCGSNNRSTTAAKRPRLNNRNTADAVQLVQSLVSSTGGGTCPTSGAPAAESTAVILLDLRLQFVALCMIAHPRCCCRGGCSRSLASSQPSSSAASVVMNLSLAVRLVWEWVTCEEAPVRLFCVNVACQERSSLRDAKEFITFGVSMMTHGVMAEHTRLWNLQNESVVLAINRDHAIMRRHFPQGKEAFYRIDRRMVHECNGNCDQNRNNNGNQSKWWRGVEDTNWELLWDAKVTLSSVNHKWLVSYCFQHPRKAKVGIARFGSNGAEEEKQASASSRVFEAFLGSPFIVHFIHGHDDEALFVSSGGFGLKVKRFDLAQSLSANSLDPVAPLLSLHLGFRCLSFLALCSEQNRRSFVVVATEGTKHYWVHQFTESGTQSANCHYSTEPSLSALNNHQFCVSHGGTFEVWACGPSTRPVRVIEHPDCCNTVFCEAGFLLHVRSDHILVTEHTSGVELLKLKKESSVVMMHPNTVVIHHHISARSQFITLGAGVIVGRCGGSSPVSTLTPPLLSQLGREWVAAPSRSADGAVQVVIDLVRTTGAFVPPHSYFSFAVSPTLGIVGTPFSVETLCDGRREFHGWVGPESTGTRFAAMSVSSDCRMVVLDTERSDACVARLSDPHTYKFCICRRWAVAFPVRLELAMTLWNFDSIERGEVTYISLPWRVENMAFDGDCSLVIAQGTAQGDVMVVDLEATVSQRRLIGSATYTSRFKRGRSIVDMWCWRGMTYGTVKREGSLFCLTTGQRIASTVKGRMAQPVGGEYFATRGQSVSDGNVMQVFSVRDPTRLCCTHMVGHFDTVHFGHGMVVRQLRLKDVEVVDAASGTIILRITPVFGFLVSRVF